MTKNRRWLSFLVGLLVGAVLLSSALAAVVLLGGDKVWLLKINTHTAADRFAGAVETLAAETLPDFIARIKPQIPQLVAANVRPQFNDITLQLGGEEFTLPTEFVDRLEQNYRTSLITSVTELLDSLPLASLGDELGLQAAAIVEDAVYAEYNSRHFELKVAGFLSLPIKIELMNQPGAEAFKLQLTAEQRPRQ